MSETCIFRSIGYIDGVKLSEQVRQAIKESGLSRYRISRETGVPESVLSRFMSGESMQTRTLDQLADLLGLRIVVKLPKTTRKLARTAPRIVRRDK